MISASLQQIAGWLQCAAPSANPSVTGVATDTRKAMPGALFVALKGERFDAHDFVAEARAQGAAAALVSRAVDVDMPQLLVADTRLALGGLAAAWRRQLAPKVVGLTGSCGKTSVKEMIAAILRLDGKTLATQGNLNNEIGVPLTLLQLSADDRYAVIEMGANHRGEIAWCASLAQPDVALVTLVAPAHLEGFGSIDGVAEAKAEIYQTLPSTATAVINLDDAYAGVFRQHAGARAKIGFGLNAGADVRAVDISLGADSRAHFTLCLPDGDQRRIHLPLPGKHNVMNALSAAAATFALGLNGDVIARGLEQAPSVAGRLILRRGHAGGTVIDDTYNANLGSVKAAIDVLASRAGRHTLVLGDMGELGAAADSMHAEAGAYARAAGVDQLLTLGTLSRAAALAFGAGGEHFADLDALLARLQGQPGNGDTVLVKGSRSARMERVVAALCPALQTTSPDKTTTGGEH